MQAERIFLETDQHGHLVHQPQFPPNIRMEAIFLIPDNNKIERERRKPSAINIGMGKILGDIISPISPLED